MLKNKIQYNDLILAGVTVRTNNKNEMEAATAKIAPLAEKYWTTNTPSLIPARKQPGKTFSVYTDYESDERGDYTYFIGEEISQESELPEGLKLLKIPASQYVKFTTDPGPIPDVIINAWRKIWLMGPNDFGGKRTYVADFEIIDVNTANPENAVFDIYIGVAS